MKIEQGVQHFPDFREFTPHVTLDDGYFDNPGIEDELRVASNTFFVTDDFVREHLNNQGTLEDVDNLLIDSMNFVENPEYAIGRGNSAQEVYFGDMEINAGGSVFSFPVACKPFPRGERQFGVREFAGMYVGHEVDELRTFEPIGFWTDEHGRATLLSHFEPNVYTLDNVKWGVTEDDKIKEIFDPLFALSSAARILAFLHAKGFVHRDAGARNMAVEYNEDGEVARMRLVDIPNMIHVVEEDDWHRWVADDLRTFIGSVMLGGFLRGTEQKNIDYLVQTSFIDVHRSVIRHPSTDINIGPSEFTRLEQSYSDLVH